MIRRGGFTLVELTVVLAIAVVLAGLVIVRVDGWSSRTTLRASARALGNLIRTYREQAELEECVTILTIDLEKGTYLVKVVEEDDVVGSGEVLRKGSLGNRRSFGVATIDGREEKKTLSIVFDAQGILPDIRIPIRSQEGEMITLIPGRLVNEVGYVEKN